jgi:GDP-4-dehydro-6-deoxy-D-mannose reductase
MAVWLVTGGTGFLGRHFLAALERQRSAGRDVLTLGRSMPPGRDRDCDVVADLAEPGSVHQAIAVTSPDVVIHLAGQTPPAQAEAYYRGNTLATLHLLEALRAVRRPVRLVLAGSAAELGPLEPDDLPVGEAFACRPASSYGLSKWLATLAGLVARPPLEVIVARIFNPIGPGLPASQAFGKFAAELAGAGPEPIRLTVGDLDARRDFIDVRDVACALVVLAEQGRAGRLYHVGSGQSLRVGDGLEHLIALCGRQVVVEISPTLAAGRGPGDVRADIGRIVTETGWRPAIDWRQSLADLWRAGS